MGVFRPHEPVKKVFNLPSRAKQSFKAECDMETILAKYRKGGMIEHFREDGGSYVDLGESIDYHQAQNIIINAQAAFLALPAAVRQKFDNDPAAFLTWMHDPENVDEMVTLGLVEAPAPDPVDPEPEPVLDTPPAE